MPNEPKHKKRPWMPERVAFSREVSNYKFYNSRKWRNFRKQIMQEEPLCRQCAKDGVVTEAKVLDHIVRMQAGGAALSKDNVQPLCSSCHNKKSGREAHDKKGGMGVNL